MLVHDGEQYFKAQLAKNDQRQELIISLQEKVIENHKEIIVHQKKLKHIIEGMENKKRLKRLDGLQFDSDQDVMVTMYFNPSPVYSHLRVTTISDNGWYWDLAWRKLNLITHFDWLELLRTINQELILDFGSLEVTPLKWKWQDLLL